MAIFIPSGKFFLLNPTISWRFFGEVVEELEASPATMLVAAAIKRQT
jgi:hypothetical protein